MRYVLVAISLLLCPVISTQAQVSVHVGIPGVSIGINLPVYPRLVRVPGYPVYYDPQVNFNYFFYDGEYWVFQEDNWYASAWYNGPWQLVEPEFVPLFVLRVPVRYYRRPPTYFRGWRPSESPRWGDRWGRDWEEKHRDWNRWDRRTAPKPAPLPTYQRPYSRDRYPHETEQQYTIRTQKYRYQPREPITQQHYQPPRSQPNPNQQRRQPEPGDRGKPNAPGKGREDKNEDRR